MKWLEFIKGNRDVSYLLLLALCFLLIGWMAERYTRQADQLRIYQNPAQLQVFDPGKRYLPDGSQPAILGITCEILPCRAPLTGGHRQCVVACTLQR